MEVWILRRTLELFTIEERGTEELLDTQGCEKIFDVLCQISMILISELTSMAFRYRAPTPQYVSSDMRTAF